MENTYYCYPGLELGNCSTVIIGKDASATGQFIVGHNEDDENCVAQTHVVPRRKYEPGSFIQFADASAVIPQVEETYAYYWSEIRRKGGISFADGFINEWGLAIVTDSCRPSRDASGSPKDNPEAYGLGYALRRLVAERAKTAREGVQIMAKLIEEFGYFSSRSYHLIDKNEAWVVQIPKGYNCVAKRLENDHVYYIPNWFTIHQIDFNDKENYYWSENLVPHAIEQGWYTPAKEGDWSDFDFARVYQDGQMKEFNKLRARNAWFLLSGKILPDEELKPFSMKAYKKYTPSDVKQILRTHYENTPDDTTEGGTKNPHRGYSSPATICNASTVESQIIELNEDPLLIRMLRTAPRPCLAPYTPWYPLALTTIPRGYEWLDTVPSQDTHFNVDESELIFDEGKAFWTFKLLEYLTEFDYWGTHGPIHQAIAKLEAIWEEEQAGIEKMYLTMKSMNPDMARAHLESYTHRCAQLSWNWAKQMITWLGEKKIMENVYSHEGDD